MIFPCPIKKNLVVLVWVLPEPLAAIQVKVHDSYRGEFWGFWGVLTGCSAHMYEWEACIEPCAFRRSWNKNRENLRATSTVPSRLWLNCLFGCFCLFVSVWSLIVHLCLWNVFLYFTYFSIFLGNLLPVFNAWTFPLECACSFQGSCCMLF